MIPFTVQLTDYESSLVEELIAERGWREDMVFSAAIRMLHKKEFNQYRPKKQSNIPEEGITAEECLKKGGEVVENNEGVSYCRITHGALEELTVIV